MKHYRARPFLMLAMALGFTVVPAIGSQGMGTLGERFAHADRSLINTSLPDAQAVPLLHTADLLVEQQVLGSIDDEIRP